jgi:Putative porin
LPEKAARKERNPAESSILLYLQKKLKRIIFISVLCCYGALVTAQVADSSRSKVKYPFTETFREKDFNPGNSAYPPVDTALDGVQRYFPENFPYSLGIANRKLIFDSSSETFLSDGLLGFRSGINSLDFFGYNHQDITYYWTRTPYTEIFGLFGMKKEQFSRILHTQNISKRWNIALNMLRIRSEGFYQHQNCTDNNIALSTNYLSKDKRCSLLANAMVSSVKSDENGGITADSILAKNLLENKKLIPINLNDARSKRLHRELYMKYSLHFGKKENTIKGDSIISSRIQPTTTLSFFLGAGDNMFAYTETKPHSDYYKHTFFDTTHTHDSIHMEQFRQGLQLQFSVFERVKTKLGLESKNMRVVQYNTDSSRAWSTHFADQAIIMEIENAHRKNKLTGFFWNIGKQYIVNGDHKGENRVYASLSLISARHKELTFAYTNAFRSVPFFYSQYSSNHFRWSKSFDKSTEIRASLDYTDSKNKFSIGSEVNQITGYVYFDSTFAPQQFNNILAIYSAFVQKKIHLGHFNFINKITWQSIQSPSDPVSKNIIHLPKLITNHSLYYEGKWFEKGTQVQFGFDVAYYSSYYADAYMPALGQYYLQNDKMIGNYPYLDFFFNMKVKHAKVFFKSEHVNSGFMGANYYLAPHMPAPDRNIKVGVSWMFFD